MPAPAALLAALLALAPPAPEIRMSQATPPQATEPSIGQATMEPDGTIILQLRATAPNAIGEALMRYPPNHPQYNAIRSHLPNLQPGTPVPVPPFNWAMTMRILPLLALLLATLATPADARSRHGRGQASAGGFDYYLLSLSLAPSFCTLSPANGAKDECRALTQPKFQQTPLTLHGLWPNRIGVSVNQQPQDCQGPPLGAFPPALQDRLARFMPAGPGLQAYEWRKHGTCSGLDQEVYFDRAARLTERANEIIGAAMRDRQMLGRQVSIQELLAAVAARDPSLPQSISVYCRFRRGGGPAVIAELRIPFSMNFAPIPLEQAGLRQNSGCPGGAGLVPAPG